MFFIALREILLNFSP